MTLYQRVKIRIAELRRKLRNTIDHMLDNSYDYFLCYYPGDSGYFIQRWIRRLINKINFDDHNIEKIKNLAPGSIIVYASKSKRVLDFLYYHIKLKSMNLPYPQIGFDFRFFMLLPVKRLFQVFVCHMDYFLHYFHLY